MNSEDGLMYDFVDVERMERLITKSLDASRGTSIPAIKRCLPRTPYLRSSDDRCSHTRLSLISRNNVFHTFGIHSSLC